MVHCKNWDRTLLRLQAVTGRKRNRPSRCRSRILKTHEAMEKRT